MVRLFVLYSKGESLTTIRLCTETPPAGGRVFEKGDELLVEFAAKIQGTFRPSVVFLSTLIDWLSSISPPCYCVHSV